MNNSTETKIKLYKNVIIYYSWYSNLYVYGSADFYASVSKFLLYMSTREET